MRWLGNRFFRIVNNRELGPVFIALGLIVLLAEVYCSAIPVITAVAIISLGTTLAVASRFRCSAALPAVIAAHLIVYLGLYLLLVGAVLHTGASQARSGLIALRAVDLLLSAVPMVAALRIALAAIAGDEDIPAR